MKANNKEELLLTLSVVQNNSLRLIYDLMFSSLGDGIGQSKEQ